MRRVTQTVSLEDIVGIAVSLHKGRVDETGEPHIGHLRRVADKVAEAGRETVAVAWLSSVLDTTDMSEAALREAGVPREVLDAVVALSRRDGETDNSYYKRVRANPAALLVKTAVLVDRCDEERLTLLAEERAVEIRLSCLRELTILAAREHSSLIDKRRVRRAGLREWALVLVVALSLSWFLRTFVIQQYYISGPSMQETLHQNERIVVNKLAYRFGSVHRFDIIVFDRMNEDHDDLIKRVIGLPGDTVEVRDCSVFINGREIDEPYLSEDDKISCGIDNVNLFSIPRDSYFVMGDNRSESLDSRTFGTVKESSIVGRATVRVWPLSGFGGL
jgi:signal peptidase I